jgi:hypothetical protein
MTSDTPVHDFLAPRLTALLDEAVANGFTREVVVAVLIDLTTSPPFCTEAPDATADSQPHPDYERAPGDPVLVAGVSLDGPPVIGRQSEADFTINNTLQE